MLNILHFGILHYILQSAVNQSILQKIKQNNTHKLSYSNYIHYICTNNQKNNNIY